jgi:hypothetical protein
MKAFAKQEQKVLTVTIDEDGDLIYLKTSEHDIFAEMGEVVTRRASHVEPDTFWLRVAFHILRTVVSDKSRIAEWTRGWSCPWRVNTAPVGGPVLTWADVAPSPCAPWMDKQTFTTHNRQEAIDAEIKFLNQFFLERGIQ